MESVSPRYRELWRAVLRAQSGNPEGSKVVLAVDRLLAEGPPPDLRAAALLVKAQYAYLVFHDGDAERWSDEGLAIGAQRVPTRVRDALLRVRVSSLARGGDPAEALRGLDAARTSLAMETVELRGVAAVAHDRNGDTADAVVAFAAWRALLADDSAAAAYAERRFSVLSAGLGPEALRSLAESAPDEGTAACLHAAAGGGLPAVDTSWTVVCRRLPQRIGVLLPRSGAMAGLADRHLAAVTASVRVLSGQRQLELVWEDPGSSPRRAREAARRLDRRGVDVVLGPVGRANIVAAAAALEHARMVLPGEPVAQGLGVAASLEARVGSLWGHAHEGAQRYGPAVVLAPSNGYGNRALKALVAAAQGDRQLTVHRYPGETTTFKPLIARDLARIKRGAPVLILDAMPRTELIVRQLRRIGVSFSSGAGARVLVLSTGEGLRALGPDKRRGALDGLVLAPAAAPDPGSAQFELEYALQEGEPPDDQALLVWRSLARVWSGDLAPRRVAPQLVQIRGSEIVPLRRPRTR